MLVELGNTNAKNVGHSDPVVTYINVAHTQSFDPNVDLKEFRAHLGDALLYNGGVTHRPDDEALLTVVLPGGGGTWDNHSFSKPSWVASDESPEFAALLSEYWQTPLGRPSDTQKTHWTNQGPPGVGVENISPAALAMRNVKGLLVNCGNDIVSRTLGGFIVGFNKATATASSSSSLTATGTPFVASAYIGSVVVDLTTGVWGIITANTTSVLTVDRWYNPATPGGAAGTTPGATDTYAIYSGGPPAWFMGLGNTNTSPSASDTTMSGEITTGGGGLIRALATYAHSASATTYTLANTFTANGTDSLPVTVYRINISTSIITGAATTMMTETTLNASATLTISGDQVTVTETVTV